MGENIPVLGFPDFSFTDGTSQNVIAWGRQKIQRNMGRENFDNKIRAIYLIRIWPCFARLFL